MVEEKINSSKHIPIPNGDLMLIYHDLPSYKSAQKSPTNPRHEGIPPEMTSSQVQCFRHGNP